MVWVVFFGNAQPKTQLHECRFCAENWKPTEVIIEAASELIEDSVLQFML